VHAGEAQKPLSKRAKYDEIMEKGNQRTKLAFGEQKQAPKIEEASFMDDEADDSFLNAALAKARRLNRLREMNKTAKGADAVVEAVKSMTVEVQNTDQSSGTMSFSVDDTREFSRALRARTEQKQREAKKQPEASNKLDTAQVKSESAEANKEKVEVEELEEDVDVDMEELAKEVKTDDIESGALEGSTAASKAGVGRGLSSFVSMLRTTGEIKGKHGGKEELRGRAKDERNYDIYEPLDLSKVVTIGKNATDKDREFANREIKLEYRDKHGRLLTQKDAYRELCYQFHGHGASKKKEEKRLKQIAREQAEARLASRQVSAARDGKTAATTLGALKATQKATGKAFIVHKT
jgi:U4/U6.U5 tri-snRNP-associated protein 1